MRVGELGRRSGAPRDDEKAAVVFDLDGTLVNSMAAAPAAYAETIRALGGPQVTPAEIVAAWHVGSTAAVLALFLGRPASTADVECFYRHFAVAGAAVRPYPGVVELLEALSRGGYRLGIFTSGARRTAAQSLRVAGLGRYFPTVVCGDDVDEPKPAPAGLRLACQRLGVDAAATTFVGDAAVDLQCAARAGAVGVHARWDLTAAPTALDGVPLVANRPADVIGLLSRRGRHTGGHST